MCVPAPRLGSSLFACSDQPFPPRSPLPALLLLLLLRRLSPRSCFCSLPWQRTRHPGLPPAVHQRLSPSPVPPRPLICTFHSHTLHSPSHIFAWTQSVAQAYWRSHCTRGLHRAIHQVTRHVSRALAVGTRLHIAVWDRLRMCQCAAGALNPSTLRRQWLPRLHQTAARHARRARRCRPARRAPHAHRGRACAAGRPARRRCWAASARRTTPCLQ